MKKLKKPEQALCYSTTGLLVDILENNGFAVESLECQGEENIVYRLSIRLGISREDFKNLLDKHLEQMNQ